jgi:hypothetical protein
MCRCIDILEVVLVGVLPPVYQYTYTYYLQYINTPTHTNASISIQLHMLLPVYQYTYTYYLQYINTPTRTTSSISMVY